MTNVAEVQGWNDDSRWPQYTHFSEWQLVVDTFCRFTHTIPSLLKYFKCTNIISQDCIKMIDYQMDWIPIKYIIKVYGLIKKLSLL